MEDNIKNKLKKIDSIDLIYMGVLLFVFIVVLFTFFQSTGFIVRSINKIFTINEDSVTQTLDIERYELVAKKLNLPKTGSNNSAVEIKTEQAIPKEVVTTSEDKKISIKINIINTTKKEGAAAMLSKKLEDSGFSKATIESKKTISPSTTVSIKKSLNEFKNQIVSTVKKSYPKATSKVIPENSEFDVIITIGK